MADEELEEQVENALGQIYKWKEVEEGLNTIYELESETESYILKVHTNDKNEIGWFRAEPEIYSVITENTDLPSPEVVYSDFSEENYESSFYIMEKLEGENPDKKKRQYTDKQLRDMVCQYGEILGEVHGLKSFGKYGFVSVEGGEFEITDESEKWSWSLEGALEAWTDIIEDEWENPPEINKPEKKEIHRTLPEEPESVIVHSDNRLDNLLVEEGEITGFLDWSHTRAGHNEYDLVRAEYLLIDWDLGFKDEETKEMLRDQLYEGYKRTGSINEEGFDERRDLYRYATTLWIAAGFANWGSHLDEEERERKRQDIVRRMKDEEVI